ncbi:MAG: long-chain fatty acid--CoA ligase [Holophagales bacterium]|nr:long-chain fatty acid--CoA ligase [Holophagales bacterium]MBK9965932.1 long-chain fatty acid--CoA ligase [Holophagales bacterium]
MIHADVLGERARLSPGKTALVFVPTGERFTFAQLNARAERAAVFLRERLGLAKGDRIGLLAHNRVEYVDLFFAAAKTGVLLVPLGTRLTPHELAFIAGDAGLSALVYGGEFGEIVSALRAETEIPLGIALDAPAASGDLPWADELAGLAGSSEAPFERTRCDGEDLHALLYTSGTTGKPKGVMVPHRMTAWNGWNTALCWGLTESDVSPVFTPLYHAGGLGAFFVPVLAAGGTIVLHAGFDPAEIWETVARERCTVVLGVPTIWKMLLEHPSFAAADLSSLRWLISGGAPLPLYLIDAYQERGIAFKQGYGLTEVGVNCFAMSVEESVAKKGSIGRPLMMTDARLVDEAGLEVPVGEVGELCLRGPHVSKGYWRNLAATAAVLDDDGYFHTGDLARRDEDGFFTIAGRRKDMLISGGVNVYPAEIEGELLLHPAVQDAAVAGVPDPTWGEVGVAFVVLRPGESLTKEELLAFAVTRLARYKLPREVVFVEALPRTAYGKVVKGELRERFLAERAGG